MSTSLDLLAAHIKDAKVIQQHSFLSRIGIATYSGPATYVITFPTGYYIGSTKRFRYRVAQHRSLLRNGHHPNKVMQSNHSPLMEKNINIYFVPLGSSNDAQMLEQLLLDDNHGKERCFNLKPSAVGMVIYDRAESTRKMIATKSTPLHRAKVSKTSVEMWSDPSYKEMMIGLLGDSVTVDGTEYGSYRAASRATGISIAAIRRYVVNGRMETKLVQKQTRQVSANGVIYSSIREAANIHDISETTMHWRVNHADNKWTEFYYVDK